MDAGGCRQRVVWSSPSSACMHWSPRGPLSPVAMPAMLPLETAKMTSGTSATSTVAYRRSMTRWNPLDRDQVRPPIGPHQSERANEAHDRTLLPPSRHVSGAPVCAPFVHAGRGCRRTQGARRQEGAIARHARNSGSTRMNKPAPHASINIVIGCGLGGIGVG
jgi:hypothetical protein